MFQAPWAAPERIKRQVVGGKGMRLKLAYG
jgi:hypothetical protein